MNETASIFAASEYAAALAPFHSKRSILSAFAAIAPDGKKPMGGNLASAWKVESAPAEIRAELFKRAHEHRARSVQDWINHPRAPWQPATPIARASEKALADAAKLREGLRPALALPDGAAIAERARAAAETYRKAFARGVSGRHLGRLIVRTLERDAGLKLFDRLELYLPDDATVRKPVPPLVAGDAADFFELQDALSAVANPACVTSEETAYAWRAVVECLTLRTDAGEPERRAKRQICAFVLKAAPWLAATPGAFRRNLNIKIGLARAQGVQAINDKRRLNSGNRRNAPDWAENIKLMAEWTRVRGGRESQAWRELYTGRGAQGRQFSLAFRDYYPFDPRSAKSQVPSRVRAAIRPVIEATDAIHLGPKAAKIALPSIHRDWSDTAAGDFYTADDVTVNHYWWEENEFGEYEFQSMRFDVMRGQWLLVTDERTDNPLSFLLLPNRNYNSWSIRTLNMRTFSDERVGLPFKGMAYEQGIWRARNIAAQFSWPEIDSAFARHGIALRVRHARGPKAKVIERVIGSAQNMMEHLPGYIGRDEMHVRYERVQKFLQSLKRVGQPVKGELDPREMLLNKEQLADELVKVMRNFADEPQNGERLQGLSPAEAWKQLSPGKPHTVLPDSLRYMLSTHRSEQTVTSEGIRLKIGNAWQYYVASAQLGALQGERVQVFYNEQLPEQVCVIHRASDPKGLNPFSVPLFERVPATTATAEDFAQARAHQKQFASFGRQTYRLIAPPANLTLRNEQLGAPELRERGENINRLEREQIDLGNKRTRHAGEIRKLAANADLGIDARRVRNPERVIKSLTRAAELEQQIRELEAEQNAGGQL